MNSFEQIQGHQAIRTQLASQIKKNEIPHALLFSGPEGIGKRLVAFELAFRLLSQEKNEQTVKAKCLSGNHPDLHYFFPTGKMNLHPIHNIKQLCQQVGMKSNEARWKVFLIDEAEKMAATSANSLLKTLEEPSPFSVIILISSFPEKILSTISSRCQKISFQPLSSLEIKSILQNKFSITSFRQLELLSSFCKGSLKNISLFLEPKEKSLRLKVIDILLSLQNFSYPKLHADLQELEKLIENRIKNSETSSKEHDEGELTLCKEAFNCQNFILETILFWYRDLEILKQNISSAFLFHQDFMNQLIQYPKEVSLEKVYQSILGVHQGIERSLKFIHCLEHLFLSLNLSSK